MSEDRVVKYETSHGEVKLSPGIIRQYLVSGGGNVTDKEIIMFLKLCEGQKLNPFLREAYLVKYGNNDPATMVVGKDVFTRRAAENPDFDGMEHGIVVLTENKEVVYRSGTLLVKDAGEKLIGGWAKVYSKGRKYPSESVVSMEEYMGRKKDGTPNRQWQRMPATMIAKVAKVQALREAFPKDFQALYDASEMGHAIDKDLPENAVDPKEDTKQEQQEEPKQEQPQHDDVEDAEYEREEEPIEQTVEDDEPEADLEDPLESMRQKAQGLLSKMAKHDLLTESQVNTLAEQLETMKSEAALKAMIKNFEGKVAAAEDKGV